MTDNIDFSTFAGRVAFPRSPSDLLNTNQCPACFTPLTSTVCTACGLDLGHAAATELHETSLATSAALDKRLAIIGRIRYDTAQAAEMQAAESRRAAELTSTPPAAPAAPTVPSPDGRRRHSSVQVTLLIVGVSLLSIAGIFFLVYAFINFGIIWRSVIIAAITIAAIVTASLLRRRKLTATAEGIAVFGVVLVYLDAFALRANNFFGLSSADAFVYWGSTIIATSAAFMLWHRISTLRAPRIVGFSAFAPGVGLLVAGLVHGGDFGTRPFFAAAAIAAAGLIHLGIPKPPATAPQTGANLRPGGSSHIERVIILSTTTLALISGFLIAFTIAPNSDWSGTIAALVLVAITMAHLWAIATPSATQPTRAFAYIFSGTAAIVAASAVSIAAIRIGTNAFMSLAPAISAVVIALALEAIALRGSATWRRLSVVGAWAAAGVFALALTIPAFVATTWTILLPSLGITETWRLAPADEVSLSMTHPGWSVLSLSIVGILAAAFWTFGKVIRQRGPILAWFAAGTLLSAVTLTCVLWIAVAGWLGIALIAVAALNVQKARSAIPSSYRVVLAATAIVSGLFAYLISWAGHSTWWIASVVVIALLVIARRIVATTAAKATLLSVATVLMLAGSFAAALHITHVPGSFEPTALDVTNGIRFSSIVAAVLFGVFAVPLARMVNRTDRRVIFWLTGVAAALLLATMSNSLDMLGAADRTALILPEYATSLISHLVFLAALVLWTALPTTQTLTPERAAASIATAPAAYFAIVAVTKIATLPEFMITIAPIVAALLIAATALTIASVRRSSSLRWAHDLGVIIVGALSVLISIGQNTPHTWLVLLVAAVAVLLLAIDNDGLFSSTSRRRHLGWVSLALATSGLWWRLVGNGVTDLEPYVLPLAGALLIVAVLLERAGSKNAGKQQHERGRAAPVVALGGLIVGILPLAVNASSGEPLRAIIIGGVSAVLMLTGSFVIGRRSAQCWWDSAALAGGIGVLVLMIGRAIFLPLTDVTRDAWLVGGFLLLLIAAFGQAFPRNADTDRSRAAASQALGLIAMAAVLVMEIPALGRVPLGEIRALGLVFLFAAVHVIAQMLQRAPFSLLVGWIAIAFAGIAAYFGVAMRVIDPPEFATVPIALALLTTGTMHLRQVAAARSWLWLAPGLIILLLPTLIETLRDQALWRIVGLGVVGVAVVIVGVMRRLQAPFVIGVVIVLTHAISTFLPQLRAAYEFVPWWLWLGIGGAVLIAVAVRFEQRRRDVKTVVMKFAELR